MQREIFSSGSSWEPIVGYSRAVRVGSTVHVAGTTATDSEGQIVGDDVYAQTRQILLNIESALRMAGAEMRHVVRTRIYLVNIEQWQQAGQAHGEVFGAIRPVTTIIEVSRLIAPNILVEIEAEAIISE